MATDADGVEDFIQDRTAERHQLADFILAIKTAPGGATLWHLVAQLAAFDDPARHIQHATLDQCRALLLVLEGLTKFKVSFEDSLSPDCRPGADRLRNQSMLLDIKCFDMTLREKEPWDCGSPDWFQEAGALLALAEQAGVQEAIASRLSASDTPETTAHTFGATSRVVTSCVPSTLAVAARR